MTRVLLTGLSGTGKSTVIVALAKRGYQAVDTDEDGWCGPADGTPPPTPFAEPGWIWRPDRMRDLLSGARESTLFVSGCVENQGDFYEYFDHVVLLSAPESLLRRRLATRTTNGYGKRPEELAEILEQLRTVEPLLRAGASMEIDTSVPLDEVVASLLTLVGDHFERGLSPLLRSWAEAYVTLYGAVTYDGVTWGLPRHPATRRRHRHVHGRPASAVQRPSAAPSKLTRTSEFVCEAPRSA